MTPADRKLALFGGGFAVVSLGIFMLVRGPLSPKDYVDAPPLDSALVSLPETNWNSPLTLPSSSGAPILPATIAPPSDTAPTASGMPTPSSAPPPLSMIPAPIVPLPLDETISEKQRARALEMLGDRLTILDKEAAAADARGDTSGASAIRVREDRMRARIATLTDASGTP
ncbi:MAG: hypothetical protein ABI461_02790 [Polyangiaceae bacterium]